MKDDDKDIDDSTAPLIEHLAELRTRLINSLIAFCVAMVAAFTVAGPIFNFLAAPLAELLVEHGQKPELIYTGLQQGFFTQVRISVFGGFVLAFPVISYQLWRFVAPGLYRQEKKAFLPFLIASPVLFLLGCAFAFYVLLPLVYDFFLGFQQFGSGAGRRAEPGRDDPVPRHDQRVPVADDEVHDRLRPLLPAAGGADADGARRAGRRRRGSAGFRKLRDRLHADRRRVRHAGAGRDVAARSCSRRSIRSTRSRSCWCASSSGSARRSCEAQGLWDEEPRLEESRERRRRRWRGSPRRWSG